MDTSSATLPWLAALEEAATYPHRVGRIEVVHTHLSVVALTGEYAYKVKKPVDYGFVDFTTLAKRRAACEAELRLNRRAAADLYLDVVPLVHTPAGWRMGGAGEPVEWAVRMRQFAPGDRLDRLAARDGLGDDLLDRLADRVAELHQCAAVAPAAMATSYPERLAAAIAGNFAACPADARAARLRALFDERLARHAVLLADRAAAGRVRDCHGDLHLANLCLWQGEPLPFDCIEFNDAFRQIDVLSDFAFLYMDLVERGLPRAARRVLNRYLEITGDYAGLPAFPLWVAYRAQVRAKIAHLTAAAPGVPAAIRAAQEAEGARYLDFAEQALATPPGSLRLMVGLPGSGKSTVALRIAGDEGGVRVRSDVERKRLHALCPSRPLYGDALGARTYGHLLTCARAIVAGGFVAILDATYLRRAYRRPVLDLAAELGVPLRIVHCAAPAEVLRERVRHRAAAASDVSDADEAVLELMAGSWEEFSEEERPLVEVVDAE
jgi:aminoglycoside phosphotransferase family enzyme/predicted kinase